MLDKIRLKAADELPADLLENLGKELAKHVLEVLDDASALEWCFAHGRRPSDDEIFIWNEFMRKRGWNDDGTDAVDRRKKESGFENRTEIQTMFDYIDADEGRLK
jgi:gluconokinase